MNRRATTSKHEIKHGGGSRAVCAPPKPSARSGEQWWWRKVKDGLSHPPWTGTHLPALVFSVLLTLFWDQSSLGKTATNHHKTATEIQVSANNHKSVRMCRWEGKRKTCGSYSHQREYFELIWKLPGEGHRVLQKLNWVFKSQFIYTQGKWEICFESL